MAYDQRHGGPYDRGAADSWYRRGCNPHYYVGDTGSSERIENDEMTQAERDAYIAGYKDNEAAGCHKEWD